jgi:hypothetical protein
MIKQFYSILLKTADALGCPNAEDGKQRFKNMILGTKNRRAAITLSLSEFTTKALTILPIFFTLFS